MLKIVQNRAAFMRGAVLLGSFLILFILIMTPLFPSGVWGQKYTLLQYADAVFNQLSKGSSWFVPELRHRISELGAATVRVSLKSLPDASLAPVMEKLVDKAGGRSAIQGNGFEYSVSLKSLLSSAVDDSSMLYDNDGEKVSDHYAGVPWEKAARGWWELLSLSVHELQKQGKVSEANLVNDVVLKAVEPGYNFYGMPRAGMSGHVMMVAALLAFYLLYTLWYGFGIMEVFEGFGLLGGNSQEFCE